ncbi:MAG TPA: response regulator [Sphingomonas sp.]|jgi:DNA-binding response OmpR family regulator
MIFARKKRQIIRLLIVEDEPLVAFDNEHFLADAAYQIVATVDSVADAVESITSGDDIDLVLVDVNLVDGSGVDVARAARERGLPVLFVAGACPDDAHVYSDGWLAKPYAQRDLTGAIEALEAMLAGKPLKRLPNGLQLFERTA